MISSCSPTKYVTEGESLLNKNHIVLAEGSVKKGDLLPYIKQKPNKEIFGARFYLGLYNLSNINKTRWPHSWLRNIGEEPVIYDPYSTTKSNEQLKSYLFSKGYFDADVKDTAEIEKQKADVFYDISTKPAYTVRKLIYEIEDTSLKKLVYFDSVNCVILRGKPYDVDLLQAERTRIERFIRNVGFYNFTGENVYYRVDSTVGNRQVDIYYGLKALTLLNEDSEFQEVPYSIFNIRNIYIYPDFVPKDALAGGSDYINGLDTIQYEGFYFISNAEKPQIKYDLIIKSILIQPGLPFNVTNSELSQSHLASLKTFRLINIRYVELPAYIKSPDNLPLLDCTIQLTPVNQQSFTVEVEGTNTEGSLGGGLNFLYQHKNLFHGAEQFNMKLTGAYEVISSRKSTFRSREEYGVETSLKLPDFLIPSPKGMNFITRNSPKTVIQGSYNYVRSSNLYTQNIANATFGYTWNQGEYKSHILNPLQFNVIKLPYIDSLYQLRIDTTFYLAYSFKDVLIIGGNYIFTFTNQKIQKAHDYWYLRLNLESAGTLLALGNQLTKSAKTDGAYNLFGLPFAQYIKTDIDLRYNILVNDFSSIVYRVFAGVGIPFGNSRAMPFAKQYFGGGANGIRAWKARSLGPGSSVKKSTGLLNEMADIKIEANAEYRFKLFWILEGAVFLDAGNIWTFHDDKDRPGSQFKLNKFIDDMAVGTGLGLRFNLDFVILRTDLGIKLRDPQLPTYPKWIRLQRPYNFRQDYSFVLGIGYPF